MDNTRDVKNKDFASSLTERKEKKSISPNSKPSGILEWFWLGSFSFILNSQHKRNVFCKN